MRINIIFTLLIVSNILYGQDFAPITGTYYWFSEDSTVWMKMTFRENHTFELIEDYLFDCTPTVSVYGHGTYKATTDSVVLMFDSIPHLKSASKIDASENNDEFSDLQIQVFDQNHQPLDQVKLCWGKPKIRQKWIQSEFFETPFDASTTLRFKNKEWVNYVRIEKEGYYWGIIEMPRQPHKDYNIEVILRPKPIITSRSYISNAITKFAMPSTCEMQFYGGRTFKKENCPE